MVRLFVSVVTLIVLLATLTIAFIWMFVPAMASSFLIGLNNTSAGLKAKTVETPIGLIHYLEGGEGETVLLIHGIYARKEHWVDVAKYLVDDYHVIALDLPGFGDNLVLKIEDYDLLNQSQNLALVIDALNLEEFHIGANSMGAYIAAQYIATEPDRAKSLSFIGSPLGIPSPISSEMEIAIEGGASPLVVKTPEEFNARNDWLSPNHLKIPSPVLRTWMGSEIAQGELNYSIWNAVHRNLAPITLASDMGTYIGPTLILWCEEDRIFHVSGAKTLSKILPQSRVEILQNCGHVPMLDQPDLVATALGNFLRYQTSF